MNTLLIISIVRDIAIIILLTVAVILGVKLLNSFNKQ